MEYKVFYISNKTFFRSEIFLSNELKNFNSELELKIFDLTITLSKKIKKRYIKNDERQLNIN
ncbi:hypothetical protein BpHYR1_029058 [Brachionus plicatilis]|uniref:Uncharacterized protein n=1 Tax=Brachionus plicatilis TaxID=10195 RepID=A0A3M7PYQ9_BRAPC|nr:hypothetical protein BpHYR1_029058 [Brachionus plicatilis]